MMSYVLDYKTVNGLRYSLFPQRTTDSNNWCSGWLKLFSPPRQWVEKMQLCSKHTTKFKQCSAEERETFCFSSTEWNLTLRNSATSKDVEVLVYMCVLVCVFSSVTALHGDYCVMWIPWLWWVFRVVQRASGVTWTDQHTDTNTAEPPEEHAEEDINKTMLTSSEHSNNSLHF